MESLGFSSFRAIMDLWDSHLSEREAVSKVHQMLDSGEFVFYFTKDGSVFGAPEESRIMFAKMMHPDAEDGKEWVKEANFVAVCLDDILEGRGTQRLFAKKDLKGVKIIDKEEAAEKLGGKKKN